MTAPRAAILGCAGTALSASEQAFFADADPWGFILFARNVEAPDQLRRLTDTLRDTVGRDAPILIDQEGGRVQRMRAPHWPEYPPALDQMRTARDPMCAQYLRNRLIAADLAAVGIDVNCAPLADLVEPETHAIVRNRLYGNDPDTVVAAARAAAQGLTDGGVLPVLKHIPGYGRARVDSHLELPRVDAPLEDLRARDFAPFRALADMPMGMTAHLLIEALDAEHPVTLSPAGIALIRDAIGFDGLLMPDDIGMEALSGSPAARTRAALDAGCDVVLHCNGDHTEMADLMAEVPPLTGDALRRADAALSARTAADGADLEALRAEYGALLAG